ncbi:MAG TPA: cupin domain-containing protein [Thermoanaerobaculia bacterium]|jgi:cupin 2 domain-containing protein|nr:cupin domain-containing protein [Thermoanaerobaculia bacterium]
MSPTEASDLFAGLPAKVTAELFTTIVETGDVRIERILSPPGSETAPGFWYDQEWDEWVLVLRGRAGLEIAGEPEVVTLGPGDHLVLAAHRRHRVAWTAADEATVWLAVHYPRGAPSRGAPLRAESVHSQ